MDGLMTPLEGWQLAAAASTLLGLALLIGAAPAAALWDRFSRWYIADLLPLLDALNIDRARLTQLLRWWGVAAIGVPLVLVFALRAPVLAIPATLLVVVAPRWWLGRLIDQRRDVITAQLAPAMVGLANTTRAGLTLSAGLATVAQEVPQPLQSELQWIVFKVRGGASLVEALESTKRRLQLDAFTLFAVTLQTLDEHGGPGPEVMDRLSDSLREMERLHRHIRNTTAGGRRVVAILAVFPLIFLGVFLVVYPEGATLMFSSLVGQGLLTITMALIAASIVWTQRILSLD